MLEETSRWDLFLDRLDAGHWTRRWLRTEGAWRVAHEIGAHVEHAAVMLHEERQGADDHERRAEYGEHQPEPWAIPVTV
jgi:hypothetical protein